MNQLDVSNTQRAHIHLVPRVGDLVAVLEADAEKVDYEGNVVLRAGSSYDPDGVQVWSGLGSGLELGLGL